MRKDPRKLDYWRREMPTSPGRILLIKALARFCAERHGYGLESVALSFDDDGRIFLDETLRSRIDHAARVLGEAFASERIGTHARAFGGGTPEPLRPTDWELDDFGLRFARSSLDPSRPFDPDAPPTHWIFVDEKGLDRLLADDGSPRQGTYGRAPAESVADERAASSVAADPDRHVRMPELEDRTGLSRATIYRRIASGRFPRQIAMDGNISVWREAEVAKWLANPR